MRATLNRGCFSWLALILLIVIYPSFASASENSVRTSSSASGVLILLIIGYICSRKRHEPIGGWLLFYFIQVFFGVFIVPIVFLIFTKDVIDNLSPVGWESIGMYSIFLFHSLVGIIYYLCYLAILVVSILIAKNISRFGKMLKLLRRLLLSVVVLSIVLMLIDIGYKSDYIALEIYSTLMLSLWCIYFFKSKRVKDVARQTESEPILQDENTMEKSMQTEKKKRASIPYDTFHNTKKRRGLILVLVGIGLFIISLAFVDGYDRADGLIGNLSQMVFVISDDYLLPYRYFFVIDIVIIFVGIGYLVLPKPASIGS
jgi:glucan phosphoethanolaminetransferase (alkaline phosphatase superfamily)